jgi:protein-disulfide isomerase
MSDHVQGTLRTPVGDDDHALGAASAPVTLLEYGDYQCPHCFRAHPIVAAVRKQLGVTLRFVFRNFPLTEVHPNAMHAAEAAESVGAHAGAKAFWAMHDAIYRHQQDSDDALDDEHLIRYAAAAGADAQAIRRDLDADAFESRVRTDFMGGLRSGVNGTPTFFINGARFDGDWSTARSFVSALETAGAGT